MSEIVAAERLVNATVDGAQRPVDVAVLAGGRTVAAWADEPSGTARLRVFGADGTPVGGEITAGAGTDVAVAAVGQGFILARVVNVGTHQVDIVAQRYDFAGQPVGGPQTLQSDILAPPTVGYRGQHVDVIPLADGGYAVSWDTQRADSGGGGYLAVHALVVDASGGVEGRYSTNVSGGRGGGGYDPHTTMTELDGGTIALAWTTAFTGVGSGPFVPPFQSVAHLTHAGGGASPIRFEIAPVATFPGGVLADGGPAVTGLIGLVELSGDRLGVVWATNGAVWFSAYSEAGLAGPANVRSTPIRLIEATGLADAQMIELPDGRFVVGWTAGGDVMIRTFSRDGVALGAAERLGTVATGQQDQLHLSVGLDGAIAAVWRDDSGRGGDASGTAVKLEVRVAAADQQGTNGPDTLTGGALSDQLSGGIGDDVLTGGGGADTLRGDMGGDLLRGGPGDDLIDGGTGRDFVSYEDAPAGVSADLVDQRATGGGGNDTLLRIEVIYGSAFDDVLRGNYLSNGLLGHGGNDVIEPDLGSDYVDGGAGTDTLVLTGTVADYFVTGLSGQDASIIGPYGTLEAHGFERVHLGGTTLSWADFTAQAFNGLRYVASNPDLIASIGADTQRALQHWTSTGRAAGLSLDGFDPMRYAASNPDLLAQFGTDAAGLTRHWITSGYAAGRSATSFDPLQYGAANPDVLQAFGLDPAALTRHYAGAGVHEGRAVGGFDPLAYGAANDDLARILGTDAQALFRHWITTGAFEGRAASGFDGVAYLLSYPELAASGVTFATAATHWLTFGADQGLRGDELFGREQASHVIPTTYVVSELDNFTTGARFSADRDWFTATAGADGELRVYLGGRNSGQGTLANGRVEVYDARGRYVAGADDDDGPGTSASVQVTGAAGASYYVVVRSAVEAEGTYGLQVLTNPSGAPDEGWVA